MAFNGQKEIEAKVHDQLHKNLSLLTYIYPPSEEFKTVFRQNMFVKNNSAAFQQVVCYLLNVLNPDLLRQKVPSWPIVDRRGESQFRSEVVKFLNELSKLYEYAELPSVLMSNVISPGGFKFTKYMFNLSQLVLVEHLKCDKNLSRDMLLPIHPNKNPMKTRKNIERLKLITQSVNEETEKLKADFDHKLQEWKSNAKIILEELLNVCKRTPNLNERLTSLQSEMNNDTFNINVIDSEQQVEMLCANLDRLKCLCKKFDMLLELSKSLLSKDLEFTYKPEMIPQEVICTFEDLNLLDVLEKLIPILENKCLEMRILSDDELTTNISKFQAINRNLANNVTSIKKIHANVVKLSLQIQEIKKQNTKPKVVMPSINAKILKYSDSTETLACPLDDSVDCSEQSLGILELDDSYN